MVGPTDSRPLGGYGNRLRLPGPGASGTDIQAFDQDVWATEGRYESANAAVALEAFMALRKLNLAFVKRLPAEKRSRFGIHQERGKESIDHLSRMYAGHDLNHLGQIAAIFADLR